MRARKLGIAILVLVGLMITSFVIAEMKDGLNVGKADAVLLGGNTLYVGGSGPNNYTKIQDAIDNASDGDIIFVYSGMYSENVVIRKSIALIGENRNNTIIDGGGSGDVVYVTSDNVTITGFTLQNSGSDLRDAGIGLHAAQGLHIENNIIVNNNDDGVYIWYSNHCTICGNIIGGNSYNGIGLRYSSNCTITSNTISNNGDGIYLACSSNCIITDNIMIEDSISMFGRSVEEWNTYTIGTSNTVNGKPVYYLKGQ